MLRLLQIRLPNYLSAPGLAWDAMLLKTNIQLDLINDLETLDFIERSKRGGLCFVGSQRHAKANNKYLDDYDSTKESTYITYFDANNLYGWAMVQFLPYFIIGFIDKSLEDIRNTPDDAEIGYDVEVDFEYPTERHDKFKDCLLYTSPSPRDS